MKIKKEDKSIHVGNINNQVCNIKHGKFGYYLKMDKTNMSLKDFDGFNIDDKYNSGDDITDDEIQLLQNYIEKSKEKSLVEGFSLINNKFSDTLKSQGLVLIEVNKGDEFDAEIHEAITQIPAENDKMKGKIIDITEQGYKLGEKIIRYPKVVVGN